MFGSLMPLNLRNFQSPPSKLKNFMPPQELMQQKGSPCRALGILYHQRLFNEFQAKISSWPLHMLRFNIRLLLLGPIPL